MRVKVDAGGVLPRMKVMAAAALAAVGEQALQDCNTYCLRDQGELMKSAITHSRPAEGYIAWVQPYAKRRYHERVNVRTGKNPKATIRWAEKAIENHKEDWVKIAQKAAGGAR